jgi:multidrug efflux system membrane fusion protein
MTIQTTQRIVSGDAARTGRAGFASQRKYLIGGGALILVLAGFYYWSHSGSDTGPRRAPPVPVSVGRARQIDMPVVKEALGTVVANTTVSVTARVQGQLTKAYFKEGQMVQTGDLLFEIDPRPFQAALTQAEGQLERDQAALVSAQHDAARYATLFAQNAISAQQRDQSDAAAKSDAALVVSDRGNVDAARLNLEFCQIRSPVDGKTGPILLQPGNLVSVNGNTTPLVTITQIKPIKVSLNLPQVDLPRIQARAAKGTLTAQVNLHDQGGKTVTAPVDFVSNAVNMSGTIELRATFPNLDGALVPGQLVDVAVQLDDIPGAIVVPRVAVINGPDGNYVYRVSPKSVVDQVPVTVQFDNGTDMAVQGGLKDGDRVITDGGLRVLPGSKVTIAHLAVRPAGGKGKGGKGGSRAKGGAKADKS